LKGILNMKVIDSFMFSEPHEKELLLLKLEMENEIVDEWVIIESSYSFQGEYKGHYINSILSEDTRFLPYRSKIKVFEQNTNFSRFYVMTPFEYLRRYIKCKHPKSRNDVVALSEEAAFFAETHQREVTIDYVLATYSYSDILLLTDVDEMFDATNTIKKESFLNALMSSESYFKIRRKVFIYDFDNLTSRMRFIPVIRIGSINKLGTKSGIAQYIRQQLLWGVMKEIKLDEDIFYEFSYCFDKNGIIRKTRTFSHTGRGEVVIERALQCNHSFKDISMINQDFFDDKENWFEKIDVNDRNLPSIIVDRFEQLRTNSVADNYKELREKYYGLKSS